MQVFVVKHLLSGRFLKGRPFATWAFKEDSNIIRYTTDDVQKARWFRHASHAKLALQGLDPTKFEIMEIN